MLSDDKTTPDFHITREDLEQTLDANGYYRGAPDSDPEKDATHVWYSSDNRRYVKFTVPEDDGQVLYGDAASGDAYITYSNAMCVLSGIMTLAQAKASKFVLPATVAAKMLAARDAVAAAALPRPDASALALPAGADDALVAEDVQALKSEPRYPDPAMEPPLGDDQGVFTPVTGKDGVF
jgi:hypothetical protein